MAYFKVLSHMQGHLMRANVFSRTSMMMKSTVSMRQFSGNTLMNNSRNISTGSSLDQKRLRVTLMPGDGIGPELCSSVMGIFSAARVQVDWSIQSASVTVDDALMSIARNHVCLKGPLSTAVGKGGSVSRNHLIRNALNLFANVVRIKSNEGIPTRHKNVDFVIIRENTEGEYIGYEQEVVRGVVQSFKTITRERSLRIARYAFEYAKAEGRKKVTAIHKANIQKVSDGEFLRACRDVAIEYPDIEYNEMIVDNTSMQLVMNPSQFDVMVTPNLYGTIVTNIGMGLVGGPGVVGSANFGSRGDAVFEPGGRHVGFDIAGMDVANPIGMMSSGISLLRHVGRKDEAQLINDALTHVVSQGKILTRDIGGTAGTKEFTQAVIQEIDARVRD